VGREALNQNHFALLLSINTIKTKDGLSFSKDAATRQHDNVS